MTVTSGAYHFDPEHGRLLLRTGRQGLGAKAGHDLVIEVTKWTASATADAEVPANTVLAVDIDAGSFAVREGTGGVKPLTDSDRRDIEKTIATKVLHTDQHPAISFRSTKLDGTPESFTVEGDLTIHGETRPATITGGVVTEVQGGARVRGSATVVQSQWGIKPYSAFFGALRLADEVQVEFDLALPPPA